MFAYWLSIFPLSPTFLPGPMSWGKAVSILYNSFLPALTLVLAGFGWNVLSMKSLAVSTKEDAYVQFARLKGRQIEPGDPVCLSRCHAAADHSAGAVAGLYLQRCAADLR